MFTGIIESVGVIEKVVPQEDGTTLTIRADQILGDVKAGDSIAVDGCCLTVVSHDKICWKADVVKESLTRTTLGSLTVGSQVNLENALRLADRLGGHMVQGHIDGIGTIASKSLLPDGSWEVAISAPNDLLRYVVEKGSIAINGVSLTVMATTTETFSFAMIPHTTEATSLGKKNVGSSVNLEVDLIAKYIEKLIGAHSHA